VVEAEEAEAEEAVVMEAVLEEVEEEWECLEVL
jgi:hypothetical protein